ncbi:MAG: hypothetical protein IT168_04350 [Bryobacterales bacterium]|nr:hypothetical protein [Bryobacterales bacterium]
MTRRTAALALLSSPLAALAQKKDDKPGFRPAKASTFENAQKGSGLVLAAAVYTSDAEASQAFGKLNPYEYGVLPVLFLIENNGKQTIRLEGIQVQYISADRQKIDNIPPNEVRFLRAPKRPKMPGTDPLPIPRRKPKNPLEAFEIEARAFTAKMLPAGESAHGFFYFQAIHKPGAKLYVTGLREAATNNDLFYFEIPLS